MTKQGFRRPKRCLLKEHVEFVVCDLSTSCTRLAGENFATLIDRRTRRQSFIFALHGNLFLFVLKNEWIEKFEIAFKFNQLNKTKKITASKSKLIERQASSIDTKSITSDALLTPTEETASVSENWAPEWLATASEEIQALIAQRHFEDALSLIQKSEEFLEKDSTFWNSAEIAGKIKNLKTELSNVLIHELSIYQNRNLQATLRSTRRPLKLLGEMGKARQACATFLKVCTSGIRGAQREARRNNLEVSELFFCDLAEVATEFMRAFKSQAACVSCE